MKTAYIFHDAFSSKNDDWYLSLKTNLEGMGYFVVIPEFPTPAGQTFASWQAVVRNYIPKFDNETIIIGHGTGGLFALRILETLPNPISGLILVASYAEPIGHAGYDKINETFFKPDLNVTLIKNNAAFIKIYAGENDPFVAYEISKRLADHLETELQIIPDGGHINKAYGFTQLVLVAQDIKQSGGTITKGIQIENTSDNQLPTPPISESEITPLSNPLSNTSDVVAEKNSEESVEETHLVKSMYHDMSTLVNSNQGSVASSLLEKARADTAQEEASSPVSNKNIIYILGTIICIIGIVIIGWLFVQKYSPALVQKNASEIPSLISAEKHIPITTTEEESYVFEKRIRAALATEQPADTIYDIYYTENTSRVSFVDVVKRLGITTLPETLGFELDQPFFMHGSVVFRDNPKHYFLMIPIKNYDQAFLGMRAWEPTLIQDTGILMNIPTDIIKKKTTRDSFEEKIIQNRLIFQTRDPENNLELNYFFINEKIVVITDTTLIVPELLKRFANRQIY